MSTDSHLAEHHHKSTTKTIFTILNNLLGSRCCIIKQGLTKYRVATLQSLGVFDTDGIDTDTDAVDVVELRFDNVLKEINLKST